MGLFRSTGRRRAVRIDEVIPPPEAKLLEQQARHAEAVSLVDAALAVQSDLEADDRDLELIELCLALRTALAPSPPEFRVPPIRMAVPVIPGRY